MQSGTFADYYDVYVDYGKGNPIKMNHHEEVFIDVKKFLTEPNHLPKLIHNKKSNGYIDTCPIKKHRINMKNISIYDSRENKLEALSAKIPNYSNSRPYVEENTNSKTNHKTVSAFTPNNFYRESSRIEPKIIYDDSWLSNKQYNTRTAAFINNEIHEKYTYKHTEFSNENKSTVSLGTYEVSLGKINHKKISLGKNEKSLCLNIAVNGASKSWRGQLPLLNSNLTNGDFGDDAGVIIDNKNYCFVGLADGAGGNRSYGINPADFSRAVLAACENIIHRTNLKPNQIPSLIKSAMQQVEAKEVQGSSTLCLLALDKHEHTLTSLNIGDSGFVIYRDNEIYSQSICTIHANSTVPKQLFTIKGSVAISNFINEKEVLKDGSFEKVKVRKGDIIILSSDGLWDVVKIDQLHRIVARNKNQNLQKLADDIFEHAVDGYIVNGRDDILIIVCRVDES